MYSKIDITTDSDIHDSKIHRWADRIRKKNGGSAKWLTMVIKVEKK